MNDLILIVEDSKTIAMYERRSLNEMGLNVVIASNYDEAKKVVDTHKSKIALAVVDINLPNCEDCVLDYLLKLNIPSIAMTGSFHPLLRDKVIDKKLIDYIVLEDDQNLELLKSTISRILNNKNTKILIVDDSKASRFALRGLLLHQNYTVLEASNGEEALNILNQHENIKVALIDYEMPNMNGAELTRLIRKNHSRMELSILAISIHSESIITIEFLKAGANDFITKPFIKEEVIARIGVNLDMIYQHHLIQKEIHERKKIEKELESNNNNLSIVLDESLVLNNELTISKEKAHVASEAKSNFLANMSHEIRTPMNAILGFIDILFSQETSEDKRKKLKIIKDSGNSLLTIINDILDISKIESGKLLIDNIIFNTKELFLDTTELFFDKAQEKNIKLQLDIDDNIPKKAYGDTTRINQVYSNLLSNAIKFSTENSSVDISIYLLEDTNKLVCKVKDYGVGIAEQNLDKIFTPFEQEDSSTTRKFGGTGLGLTISKTLVELMGGRLEVKSSIGNGSEFFFSLDIFTNVNENIKKDNIVDDIEESSGQLSGNILLVEDNKSNILLMEILLEELGLEVIHSFDGIEAIEEFKKGSFSLILMDENMPNMNGIEATKHIREIEHNENRTATPIIAATANAFKEDKERFLAAGMDDYISKPINRDKLEKILRKYLA